MNASTKVAYVVLAHSDPQMFGRLMRRLSHPSVAAFVHVDGRSDQRPFEAAVDGVSDIHFVADRVQSRWAGFSLVESTLRAFELALSRTTKACTHFVVISGADYPLVPNDTILGFFAACPERQFIRRFSLMESGDAVQMWRVRGRYFREWADRFTWKRKPLFVLERLFRLFPRHPPAGLRVVLGSQWVALTRSCVAYCVSRARDDRRLLRFFRPSFAPDEMFIHTLVQDSPFAAQAEPIESYSDITTVGGPFHYGNVHLLPPKVPIVSAEAARAILDNRGDKLFTRKLSSTLSEAALAVFDEVGHSAR
ncbi:hypothetical protein D3273_26590 [Lichenibacterium minor]|uniref:Peptide O-xylosyltransferase n=1 Tax=Lichenibacterium minor TaxID=2316528 RepID=A0A4Q2TXX0_9HYPH|nr:beta-1,6-N-acetylglucosaminyltransferase [Lichenibacterium minor]RYC28952.1 hypothetical protein D3273_26590 [Lichenibacterium minor]